MLREHFCYTFSKNFINLPYYVPGLVLFYFKRPQVNIHQYLVLALEVLWYPPRVPAGAASAILEFAGGKHVSRLIDNFQFWRRASSRIPVVLTCLADNRKIYRDPGTAFANFGLNQKRRAQF